MNNIVITLNKYTRTDIDKNQKNSISCILGFLPIYIRNLLTKKSFVMKLSQNKLKNLQNINF